jgi:hypothetical protein
MLVRQDSMAVSTNLLHLNKCDATCSDTGTTWKLTVQCHKHDVVWYVNRNGFMQYHITA